MMNRSSLYRVLFVATAVTMIAVGALAADYAAPVEGDHVLKDFRFASGESLPELRIHYRTLGTIERDASGTVRNAVLILHGTGGEGGNFLRHDVIRYFDYERVGEIRNADIAHDRGFFVGNHPHDLTPQLERLHEVLDGIARGEFPARPHEERWCRYCAYSSICRKDYIDDE